MTDTNVVPLALSKAAAARLIKELSADMDNIVPVGHARKRMVQRRISITQARRIVQAGYIDGDPWLDEHGYWRVTMRGVTAGDEITVGVAIEWRTKLLIITVF